jgi:hypothetical protein
MDAGFDNKLAAMPALMILLQKCYLRLRIMNEDGCA